MTVALPRKDDLGNETALVVAATELASAVEEEEPRRRCARLI